MFQDCPLANNNLHNIAGHHHPSPQSTHKCTSNTTLNKHDTSTKVNMVSIVLLPLLNQLGISIDSYSVKKIPHQLPWYATNSQIESKLRAFCMVRLWQSRNFQLPCWGRLELKLRPFDSIIGGTDPSQASVESSKAKAREWRTYHTVIEANWARGD